ncbi:unnamed protein product, partial [Closterium sp. NIES-54]
AKPAFRVSADGWYSRVPPKPPQPPLPPAPPAPPAPPIPLAPPTPPAPPNPPVPENFGNRPVLRLLLPTALNEPSPRFELALTAGTAVSHQSHHSHHCLLRHLPPQLLLFLQCLRLLLLLRIRRFQKTLAIGPSSGSYCQQLSMSSSRNQRVTRPQMSA